MKNSLVPFFIAGLSVFIGCGTSISNPCEQFSQAQSLKMMYSPTMDGEYVEIDERDRLVIAQVLKSPPKQLRGNGDGYPLGYIKIQDDLFKISASLEYVSEGGHLRWSDKRIGNIGIALGREYSGQ